MLWSGLKRTPGFVDTSFLSGDEGTTRNRYSGYNRKVDQDQPRKEAVHFEPVMKTNCRQW